MVWMPPSTGSHTGGRWVEVDRRRPQSAGALNVKRGSAEATAARTTEQGPQTMPRGAMSPRVQYALTGICIAHFKIGAVFVDARDKTGCVAGILGSNSQHVTFCGCLQITLSPIRAKAQRS